MKTNQTLKGSTQRITFVANAGQSERKQFLDKQTVFVRVAGKTSMVFGMISIEQLLFYAGCAVLGIVLSEVIDYISGLVRTHVPYGDNIVNCLSYPFRLYMDVSLHCTRYLVPDMLYKLWYETGIMDIESYRAFQAKGYIRDDLDPEYIQRSENHE